MTKLGKMDTPFYDQNGLKYTLAAYSYIDSTYKGVTPLRGP